MQYIPYMALISLICMHSHFSNLTQYIGASKFRNCLASTLTTATSSDPTPLSIGHAGMTAVSLQGVPLVTGIGHCGSKGCTRATSITVGRSFGGRTTVDSCKEGTVTTFHVTKAHAIQHKE